MSEGPVVLLSGHVAALHVGSGVLVIDLSPSVVGQFRVGGEWAVIVELVAGGQVFFGPALRDPGGDFEAIQYPENSVVIDNPPFSIISKIVRFYVDGGIPFFLFAPHLTLFSSDVDCTHIVVGGNILYENGATVKTSFLSNMFGDAKVIGDAGLYQKFKQLEASQKNPLPKYEYPAHVVTVSGISFMVEKGVSIKIDKKHARHHRGLDSQRPHGKAIFGSGFLISESAALEKAALEKAALEKAAAEKVYTMVWELSEKEQQIINSLGQNLETL